jgi:hypothetical protein
MQCTPRTLRPFVWTKLAVGVPLLCLLLAMVSGCGTSSQSGITYSFYMNVFNLSVPRPLTVNSIHTVTCPKGQYVLAGGFNLTGVKGLTDWAVAHPPPIGVTPDADGLYRPISNLLRVVSSEPLSGLNGWMIQVSGKAYPGPVRPIAVYAYCVAGLSAPPQLVAGPVTTSSNVSLTTSIATCPAGTIATGGGFSAGIYIYPAGSGQSEYLPIYTSIPNTSTSWLVEPGLLTPGYSAPLIASFSSEAVCASAKQFILVGNENSASMYRRILINTMNPQNPQSAQTTQYTQNVQSIQVGQDTDYAYHLSESDSCPAGSFSLPPAFDFFQSVGATGLDEDLRVDAALVDISLASWDVDVSLGGAPASHYSPQLFPEGYVYIGCLMSQ